jgi:predicted esterase
LRDALTTGTNALSREDTVFGYDQYRLDTTTALPLTFAFETRQDGLGVLQITGFNESPPGVKLRYKLVQTGNASSSRPAQESQSDDVADVPSEERFADGDTNKLSLLIDRPKTTGNKTRQPLLLVLPGGDGGRAFHPFVKRIFKNALPEGYLVAQPVAPKWDEKQFAQLVWPTETSRYPAMKFSTEEFVNAVVADIEKDHPLDSRRIFTLSWSSGGPAGYATSLHPGTRVTGSVIAMSVFKPDQLPEIHAAKAHAYYLLHSPEDFIPMRMPEMARDTLASNGAKVHLQTYPGGHGWHGDVYGMIGDGVRWLEQQTASSKILERANP